MGMGGDTLQMSNGVLFRNGRMVSEPYVHTGHAKSYVSPVFSWQKKHLAPGVQHDAYQPSNMSWGPIVVPANHAFVLGDNRSDSEDSRHWGFIPDTALIGRPLIVYFSLDRRSGEKKNRAKIRWSRIGQLL